MTQSRREGNWAELSLSLKLKGREEEGREGKSTAVYGDRHGPLCGPLHLDPLMRTVLGLFYCEMPKVNASLWQYGLFERINVCCASSFRGAHTSLSGRAFLWKRQHRDFLLEKGETASTEQPCLGAVTAHRMVSSTRSFLSQICPPRTTISPANRGPHSQEWRDFYSLCQEKDLSLPVRKWGEMRVKGPRPPSGAIAPTKQPGGRSSIMT